ncbi:MAG: hypothetical protein A2X84_08180 [Desulfuromonadaceae bacterium GWC2_58_13]|nr:MAG: hypothetical protein A2X84_08180 [Desulfuromonadaceae bacterium GWC2_58_13]
MNVFENWGMVKSALQVAMKSSHHLSFATVTEDGYPHVTPIGSLILRDDCTGYYFEEYTIQMPENLKNNQRISILAVNSGFLFWIKSIYSGRFSSHPGIRLHGKVGERRPATESEIAVWQNRVKSVKKTKGYELIWKNLKYVRDIQFDSFEPITAGKMTKHLI